MLKYVVCLCKGCDRCCIFVCIVTRGAVGRMSVSSCRSCMFVFCVHSVVVLNAAFRMTCSLLKLVEDARDEYMEEAYSVS